MRGPIDTCDACAAMTIEACWAFSMKWATMRHHLHHHPIDLETGEYRYRRDWHFDDSFAQAMGMPYALLIGMHTEGITVPILTNWIGDDGFVRKLDFNLRYPVFHGDMLWIKGKVIMKYEKNGEHLVDLEVWSDNQNGNRCTKCSATVQLIPRKD